MKKAGKGASRQAKSQKVFSHTHRRAQTLFRVGLYARVSTQDQQTIPLQTRALREYAIALIRNRICVVTLKTTAANVTNNSPCAGEFGLTSVVRDVPLKRKAEFISLATHLGPEMRTSLTTRTKSSVK